MRTLPSSLHDDVALQLRNYIFDGQLRPGSFIDEVTLCELWSISRTPLREALKVLTARIHEKDRSERAAKDAAERKSLVGSGDRSDRIRTYNFPQGRLTDHRINLTLYKLLGIMEGDMDDVVEALQAYEAAQQLAALENHLN